jgi:anti-sigma factor RsiW
MNDESDRQLSELIREHATRYRASPALESAVRTEITLQSAAVRPQVTPSRWRWPSWAFVGMGFACGLVFSTATVLVAGRQADSDRLEAELVGSHVRALMVSHLTDVASSNQHTVKPWFQGKLNYSPPVRDLDQDGFPLVGGRLDYLAGKPVAALVYRRNGHMIDLFIWPDANAPGSDVSERQGYNVMRWTKDGMTYSAVSDLNLNELRAFSELMH